MISPDIKDLMRNMDSRYTLVVTAAKRARQLTAGAEPLTRFQSDKTVTLAIHEIAEGKVDYFRATSIMPELAGKGEREYGRRRDYFLYDETGDFDDGDDTDGDDRGASGSVFYDYTAEGEDADEEEDDRMDEEEE